MGIRNASIEIKGDISEGLDNTTAIDSPTLKNTLSKALNVDLVSTVLTKKRNGTTTLATWGTKVIRQGIEYVDPNFVKHTILFGYDTPGNGLLADYSSLGSPIKSSLATTVKPVLVQFNNRLFFFNGVDDFIYDGSTTHQIGIDAPTGTPVFNSAGVGGSLNVSSSYLYAFTYYNSVTGAESTPSAFSSPMLTGGADTKILVDIPVDASVPNADTLVIYRSTGGGTFLQYEDEKPLNPILGTTYTYISTTADISLGDLLELDNNRPPLAPFAAISDNRIFLAGMTDNPNRIVYSKIGLSGPMPESFQALDFCDCNQEDGDQIVGLSVVGPSILVFKNKSTGKLLRLASNEGGSEIQGSPKYVYQELSKTTTFLDNSTVLQTNEGTVFLGHDELYFATPDSVTPIGKRISSTISRVNLENAWKYTVVNKVDTKQFIFSVALGADTEPDFQIVGHYDIPGKIRYTFYSYGPAKSIHPGISAGSLFEVTGADNRRIYYAGTTDGSGKILQIDSGTSDNGFGIYFDVRLPWNSGRSYAQLKKYHSSYILATGTSEQHTITQFLETDKQGIVASNIGNLTRSSSWTNVNWTRFNWAGLNYKRLKFFPRKVGYIGRFGFSNIEADQPVAIQIVNTVYQNMEIH